MAQVRDVGNSLRRTRVSWRWLGVDSDFAGPEFWGVREMDQASPLRKRTLDAAATELELEALGAKLPSAEEVEEVICFPDLRIEDKLTSSHRVSHP